MVDVVKEIPTIGSMIWDGNYSVQHSLDLRYGKRLKYFEYNWQTPQDEKIVVFSDYGIPAAADPLFDRVKYKIAWMLESPWIYSAYGGFVEVKKWLLSNLDKFEAVATYDDSLISEYPDKMMFVPLGTILVPKELSVLYKKTKLCSMISGNLYPLRNKVYEKYKNSGKVDFLGKSFNKPFNATVDALRDYMYHLTLSNCCANRYFGSNLLDSFACGTVPVWFGCSKIGDFFDMNGIIVANSFDEINEAIKKMCPKDYASRSEAIAINQKLAEKYRTVDNTLWENVLLQLWEKC